MKAKISVLDRLTAKERAELHEREKAICKEYIDERMGEAFRRYMMLTAVSLSKSHGFGQKRLRELFDELSVLVQLHAPEDEEFWTHIETRCRQLELGKYFKLEVENAKSVYKEM